MSAMASAAQVRMLVSRFLVGEDFSVVALSVEFDGRQWLADSRYRLVDGREGAVYSEIDGSSLDAEGVASLIAEDIREEVNDRRRA